jgi:peptidoglycan/LPS O-acetylase OafA/YrhL
LRGIAALWVVLYHYTCLYFPNLHPENYSHVIEKGYLAVDLFFMLSGYVLAHAYRSAFLDGVRTNYFKFLAARVARLYPLHLLILALFVLTALAWGAIRYAVSGQFQAIPMDGPRSVTALFANLFMLQGVQATELSWNYPAWSISLEFFAYLVFPFLASLIWRISAPTKCGVAILMAIALGWLAYLTAGDFNQWEGPITLLRCLPEFIVGMLLYTTLSNCRWNTVLGSDVVNIGVLAMVALLLHFGAPDLLIVMLFVALVHVAVTNQGVAIRFIDAKPLVWLGELSYSLYLVHGFVQYVTTYCLVGLGVSDRGVLSSTSSLLLTIAMLLACLVMADFSYRWIETAARRHLRSLFGLHGSSSNSGVFGQRRFSALKQSAG